MFTITFPKNNFLYEYEHDRITRYDGIPTTYPLEIKDICDNGTIVLIASDDRIILTSNKLARDMVAKAIMDGRTLLDRINSSICLNGRWVDDLFLLLGPPPTT